MSSRLNLNDNASATFPFTIGGVDFDLKYPTLEELEPISQLNNDRQTALDSNDMEKVAEIDKKLEEVFYGFIVPVDGVSKIQDVLKKQTFKVVQAFNQMVKDQLSVE